MQVSLNFSEPLKIAGPNWIARAGGAVFERRVKGAASVLIPCRATHNGREIEFDWPGEIRDGTLTAFEIPEETCEEVSRYLGVCTIQARVSKVRALINTKDRTWKH